MNCIELLSDSLKYIKFQGSSYLYPKPPDSYSEHQEGKSAVLLLPSLLGKWNSFGKLAKAISNRRYNIYVPDLGNNLADLDTSSKEVIKVIESNHLLPQATFAIGESYGGIIGWYLLYLGKISGLIAVSAPLSGSDLAKHFPWIQSVRDLSPDSQIFQDLMKNNRHLNEKVVSIHGKHDNFIPNPDGSYLPGAKIHEIFKNGHFISEEDDVIGYAIRTLDRWEKERYRRH